MTHYVDENDSNLPADIQSLSVEERQEFVKAHNEVQTDWGAKPYPQAIIDSISESQARLALDSYNKTGVAHREGTPARIR